MDKYKEIEELLMKYSNIGLQHDKYVDGTWVTLIGNVPFYKNYTTWLNQMYSPLTEFDMIGIERELRIILPESYKQFLTKFSNGLTFMQSILLYGKRYDTSRRTERWQPADILFTNIHERPVNTPAEAFYIGYYKYDATNLFMTPDGVVHYCARWDATTLHTWSSIEEFLISEIERIYELYNDKGERIVPGCPTSPMHLLDL